MDSLFLPKASREDRKQEDRRISRFTFKSYYLPKLGNFQYSGFYYIGKSNTRIGKLVNMYKRGYAADSLEHAKAELLRSLSEERNIIPEVILFEARFGATEIRNFIQFLREHPALSSIPCILDGSSLSGNELFLYKKSTRPDEIIFLDSCDEAELKNKIAFLRKIKAGGTDAAAPRIEETPGLRPSTGHPFKRGFDILISVLALILLSPLFLLIAIAIKVESKGAIFYIAKRAGRGYKIFNFYKFRTMHLGADKRIEELTHLNQYNGLSRKPVFFKMNNDPRITRIGSFLRNTSLDELPQLINVLLGDMSLVGNRPLPLYEAANLTTDEYAARFMAPAGITGLWQIKKRGNKDMSAEERIHIDIAYAARCSFVTDLWIIANTPSALLQKENV